MTRTRSRARLGVLATMASLAAVGACTTGRTDPKDLPAATSTGVATETGRSPDDSAAATLQTAPSPGPATVPVRIRIPSISVDSGLQPLGLTRDGLLQTPSRWQVAGWFAGGVRPGLLGPAVIAGHVDSRSGPAVFFRLRDLRPGAAVLVTQAGGATLRFVVDRTQQFSKRRFPSEVVYGPTSLPLLRLVTCTGRFDVSRGSYVDNLVVTASLVSR